MFNTWICKSLAFQSAETGGHNFETNQYTVADLESNRFFDSSCIDGRFVVHLSYNNYTFVSMYMHYTPVRKFYFNRLFFNIDMRSKNELTVDSIIDRQKKATFVAFVRNYAAKNKIDNIYRSLNIDRKHIVYQETHRQNKIIYLEGIDNELFYLKNTKMVFFTKVNDLDKDYWMDKNDAIGIVYMEVEIPLSEMKPFIKKTSPLFKMIK